jgi:penicillin amidase
MKRFLLRVLRFLSFVFGALLLVALLAGGWFYFQLRASLPQLDGTQPLAGLEATVTITRDDHGVPTVRASSRRDVARALGFLHAQERFFQMDLMRRRAAGELAELFGPTALPLDRKNRPHRFRDLAQRVLDSLPADHRALLESYSAGVNTGLTALGAKPFEYLVLRHEPHAWSAVDSLLVAYTMTLDLQDPTNSYERALSTLRDTLGPEALAFFVPLLTPDDAAVDGTTGQLAPIPGPRVLNLREPRRTPVDVVPDAKRTAANFPLDLANDDLRPGSNSFALSGTHTATGTALLANDPHLDLAVPNIWYRAVLEWPRADAAPSNDAPHRIVGVTLAGLPLVVLGSNGHVAWGLTDAYADTNDLVVVDTDPLEPSLYRVPGNNTLQKIEIRRDAIPLKDGTSEVIETSWTHWGPIIAHDQRQRPLAHRWVAYDVAATNLNYIGLETATTTAQAVAVAHESGIPAHNILIADRHGTIAWTIAGKFPRRIGFDGRLPESWTFRDRRWDGYVAPADVPTVLSPASGRLWTANNRIVGGDALRRIGDGGYAPPPRAAQARDALAALTAATPHDLAAIQIDDRALFLDRWQSLLLTTLTPEAIEGNPARAEFRTLVENWIPRASVDSVGYRLVRNFRSATANLALAPIFAPCRERMRDFNWRRFNYEPALWTMLHEQPPHLLSPEFASWHELLVAAVDAVIADLDEQNLPLARATWGDRNRARIRHPFSHVLPSFLAQRLNRPADPLPGDEHMPLMQSPGYGASMRLVVSPGREEEGLFQMPGGQSGHPLSPFYETDHSGWVRGEPSPLLPGETRHTLTLTP